MVGRLVSFWGPAYFQGRTVSFRGCINFQDRVLAFPVQESRLLKHLSCRKFMRSRLNRSLLVPGCCWVLGIGRFPVSLITAWMHCDMSWEIGCVYMFVSIIYCYHCLPPLFCEVFRSYLRSLADETPHGHASWKAHECRAKMSSQQ